MTRPRVIVLALLFALPCRLTAAAEPLARPGPSDPPGLQCRKAIRAAERANAVPEHLMAAIAHVESGRRDRQDGSIQPWPWTINAEGQGFFFDSKAAAISAVQALRARGVQSIDVGCMQVNLEQHPDAFRSLDQAFDPQANADYAGRFLAQLYERSSAWPKATAFYHSATPDLGADYQTRVSAAWPGEKAAQLAALGGDLPPAGTPYAATGRVAVFMPPNRSEAMRVMRLGGTGEPSSGGGRTLDSYRAMPVQLATRAQPRG